MSPGNEATYYSSGATRDSREGKPVFDKFLSVQVLRSYGAYMHEHRKQSDGRLRTGDNWKHGIPENDYLESMFRHFLDVWESHENGDRRQLEESLNAVLFNAIGMQHENLKHLNSFHEVSDYDWTPEDDYDSSVV